MTGASDERPTAGRETGGRETDASEATPRGADIIIVTEGVTDQEMAAVTAVLSDAIAEATSHDVEKVPGPTAWQRSTRALRHPIVPGPGAWTNLPG